MSKPVTVLFFDPSPNSDASQHYCESASYKTPRHRSTAQSVFTLPADQNEK